MNIHYFEKWVFARKSPVLPLTPEAAARRHERREPYVAVISNDTTPQYVIDLAGEWVSSYFLDKEQRVYLEYDFKSCGDGSLFLSQTRHMEYEPGSDELLVSTTFVFDQDGNVEMEKKNHNSLEIDNRKTTFNRTTNQEAYPLFGQYSRLCVADRRH